MSIPSTLLTKRRWLVPVLLGAVLVPCGALAVLGLVSLAADADTVERRYHASAEGAARAAVAAIESTAAALPEGAAIAHVVRISGAEDDAANSRAGSRPESRSAVDSASAEALFLAIHSELDPLEKSGNFAQAIKRLRTFTARYPASELSPVALTAIVAIAQKAGDKAEITAACRELITSHPESRDARGLKRAFAARLTLLDSGDAGDSLVGLYADLISDHSTADASGTEVFKRAVRERLGDTTDPRVDGLDAHDRERELERALRTAVRGDLAPWIASGATGLRALTIPKTAATSRSTDFVVHAIVAAARDRDGAIVVAAAPVRDVANAAFQRPEMQAVRSLDLVPELEPRERDPTSKPFGLVRQILEPPFPPVTLTIRGRNPADLRESARRSFLLTAALAVAGLLAAGAAAFATVRAVNREMAAVRDREAFVAAVTHELKTPLASIRLLAELLSRGGVAEAKAREFGSRVVAEADRLARLVASVLELARVERGQATPARRLPLDAREVARDAIALFDPVAREAGFTLALRVPAQEVPILGEKDALTGALLNLLDNAIKYAEAPHEIEVEVTVEKDNRAVFAVNDRGRGVPAAERKRIFEPFARAGDELTRDRPGVGLGLALVSRVVAAHDGHVACEPRHGGGTRFAMDVPLSAIGPAPAPAPEGNA